MELWNQLVTKLFVVIQSLPHQLGEVFKHLFLKIGLLVVQRIRCATTVLDHLPIPEEVLFVRVETLNLLCGETRASAILRKGLTKFGSDPVRRPVDTDEMLNRYQIISCALHESYEIIIDAYLAE